MGYPPNSTTSPALMMNTSENYVTLRSGRILQYATYGSPSAAHSILYAHGFPGSGEEVSAVHKAASKMNLRIIAPHRPGIAGSTYYPRRTIADWPEMMREFLDLLEVERVSLLGVSGGTPYALACAAHLRDRVDRCLIVSGMGPPDSVVLTPSMSLMSRIPLWFAYRTPRFAQAIIRVLGAVAHISPTALLSGYRISMSHDDKKILKESVVAAAMLRNIKLSLAQGTAGIVHDFKLLTADWALDVSQMTTKVIFLHGEDDLLVPIEIALNLSQKLPHASFERVPERGHFMALAMTNEILNRLV